MDADNGGEGGVALRRNAKNDLVRRAVAEPKTARRIGFISRQNLEVARLRGFLDLAPAIGTPALLTTMPWAVTPRGMTRRAVPFFNSVSETFGKVSAWMAMPSGV